MTEILEIARDVVIDQIMAEGGDDRSSPDASWMGPQTSNVVQPDTIEEIGTSSTSRPMFSSKGTGKSKNVGKGKGYFKGKTYEKGGGRPGHQDRHPAGGQGGTTGKRARKGN